MGQDLNYYPSAVRKFIWYLGTGVKIANAAISGPLLTQNYDYFQTTVPSFQFGIKYRFRAGDEFDFLPSIGVGWNLVGMFDNYSFYNSGELKDDINENKTALIIKLMIMAAIYEFLYMHKIPIKVIINEYLKVSDFFIENSQKKYLNAILDKVSKTSRLKNQLFNRIKTTFINIF